MELEGMGKRCFATRGEWLALPEGENEEAAISAASRKAMAERVGF